MPIVQDTPNTPPVEQQVPIHIAAPEFKGVTVDTRYQNKQSLLTHIEGSSWTVNYYNRILDQDNGLQAQNMDMAPAYQQYRLIQRFEFKVTTPLTQNQNQETKEITVTGQANVYPYGVIPNLGDMFIADVGDGREGVFTITSSEIRTMYKDAAYLVDYLMVGYSDTYIDDLNEKVVANLYFVQDFLTHGQNPLLSLSEYEQLRVLNTQFDEVLDDYFKRFVSKEYSTLVIPGQRYPIYDPMLTKHVLKMFRNTDNIHLNKVRELNVGDLDAYDTNNIWTAFINKRKSMLKGGMQNYGLISVRNLTRDPMLESARYSGMEYLICPKDPDRSEDDVREGYLPTFAEVQLQETPSRLTRLFDLISITTQAGLPIQMVSVNPVSGTNYIFSNAFYNNDPIGQSALELQIRNYLDGRAYDIPAIVQLTTSYRSWGLLEQFFQLPFLLAMIQAIIRRM